MFKLLKSLKFLLFLCVVILVTASCSKDKGSGNSQQEKPQSIVSTVEDVELIAKALEPEIVATFAYFFVDDFINSIDDESTRNLIKKGQEYILEEIEVEEEFDRQDQDLNQKIKISIESLPQAIEGYNDKNLAEYSDILKDTKIENLQNLDSASIELIRERLSKFIFPLLLREWEYSEEESKVLIALFNSKSVDLYNIATKIFGGNFFIALSYRDSESETQESIDVLKVSLEKKSFDIDEKIEFCESLDNIRLHMKASTLLLETYEIKHSQINNTGTCLDADRDPRDKSKLCDYSRALSWKNLDYNLSFSEVKREWCADASAITLSSEQMSLIKDLEKAAQQFFELEKDISTNLFRLYGKQKVGDVK